MVFEYRRGALRGLHLPFVLPGIVAHEARRGIQRWGEMRDPCAGACVCCEPDTAVLEPTTWTKPSTAMLSVISVTKGLAQSSPTTASCFHPTLPDGQAGRTQH